MKTPHKHAALIAEWIQDTSRDLECSWGNDKWETVNGCPSWLEDWEFRFKPEPKPDVVLYYFANIDGHIWPSAGFLVQDNLKLTFDSQTGKLKSAEVLK